MKTQNYKNHLRYYTAHHFVLYPVLIILFIACIYQGCTHSESKALWLMLAVAFVMTGLVSYMMRQHYALNNQNRIVRLEMRLRYYILTQKHFDALEAKLTRPQIFALRFAPDEELPALLERALKENLSADEIKRAIKNWQADDMRV